MLLIVQEKIKASKSEEIYGSLHNNLCHLIPYLYIAPPPFFSSLVNNSLLSMSVSLFLFYHNHSFVLSFRFHI